MPREESNSKGFEKGGCQPHHSEIEIINEVLRSKATPLAFVSNCPTPADDDATGVPELDGGRRMAPAAARRRPHGAARLAGERTRGFNLFRRG